MEKLSCLERCAKTHLIRYLEKRVGPKNNPPVVNPSRSHEVDETVPLLGPSVLYSTHDTNLGPTHHQLEGFQVTIHSTCQAIPCLEFGNPKSVPQTIPFDPTPTSTGTTSHLIIHGHSSSFYTLLLLSPTPLHALLASKGDRVFTVNDVRLFEIVFSPTLGTSENALMTLRSIHRRDTLSRTDPMVEALDGPELRFERWKREVIYSWPSRKIENLRNSWAYEGTALLYGLDHRQYNILVNMPLNSEEDHNNAPTSRTLGIYIVDHGVQKFSVNSYLLSNPRFITHWSTPCITLLIVVWLLAKLGRSEKIIAGDSTVEPAERGASSIWERGHCRLNEEAGVQKTAMGLFNYVYFY